jgi:DNA-binding NarL/FixJ family response regulator
MTARIRVLLCDDHELFREGIKALLQEEPGIEILGEARDGAEALEKALGLRPDVALMDMEMPNLNGLEATLRIRRAAPEVQVLILTMYAEEDLVARCMEAGAAGYILKDMPASQLVYAIEAVSAGGTYISPSALKGMVEHYRERASRAATATATAYDLLTEREREIVKMLAEGLSAKQIALRLRLSSRTVDVHKTNLMRKLDVHGRADLTRWAIRNKVIRLPVLK